MKISNWQTALDTYLISNAKTPFSYDPALGLDCCRFTFKAIQVQTGIAVGANICEYYSTRREALDVMRKYCGRPSLGMAIGQLFKEHGFAPRPAMYAQRGDAVLVPKSTGGEFLGILDMGGKDVISVAEQGLVRVPISIRCRAWRIA